MRYLLNILLIMLCFKCFGQVISNAGAVINISPGTSLNSNTIENTTGTLSNNGTIYLTSDFNNASTTNGSGIYNIAGNWNNTGTFTPASSTVIINGNGSQNISSTPFNHLSINKATGTATLTGTAYINGDLTLTSGTLDASTYLCNRVSLGGTFTIASNAYLLVSGANNFPSNFSVNALHTNSTVEYNGNVAQTISPVIYGNLILTNGTANKTLSFPASVAGNFIINSAAEFTNTSELKIAGSISNSGTFMTTNGTVELNGTSAQTIPANTFSTNTIKSIIINNAAGVSLGGTLNVNEVVKVMNGNFSTNDHLTLLSTLSKTALIDGTGTGEVTGDVTMQRYLPSGFGYKYVSSPFTSATVNEFSDDLDLAAAFPSFYSYDESEVSSGWVDYTDVAGILDPMVGYAANFGTSTAAKTIDITGEVNNHAVTLPTLYNNNNAYTLGFNLVGNPYPSPIDWLAASGWTKTNIDDAIYFFNAGITDQYTGTYSSYINGVSSDDIANNIIPSMQGFFVHVSNGAYPVSATLAVNNSARVNNLSAVFFKTEEGEEDSLIRLEAGFDGSPADPLVIYFPDGATDKFEKTLDALKLKNTNILVPSFYVLSDDKQHLSISAMKNPDEFDIIPLGIEAQTEGSITVHAIKLEGLADDMHIYFADAETGLKQDLKINPSYKIQLAKGTYEERFSLVFSKQELAENVNSEYFDANYSDGLIHITSNILADASRQLILTNMLGQIVWQQVFTGDGNYTFQNQLDGEIFILSLTGPQRVCSKKLWIGTER